MHFYTRCDDLFYTITGSKWKVKQPLYYTWMSLLLYFFKWDVTIFFKFLGSKRKVKQPLHCTWMLLMLYFYLLLSEKWNSLQAIFECFCCYTFISYQVKSEAAYILYLNAVVGILLSIIEWKVKQPIYYFLMLWLAYFYLLLNEKWSSLYTIIQFCGWWLLCACWWLCYKFFKMRCCVTNFWKSVELLVSVTWRQKPHIIFIHVALKSDWVLPEGCY